MPPQEREVAATRKHNKNLRSAGKDKTKLPSDYDLKQVESAMPKLFEHSSVQRSHAIPELSYLDKVIGSQGLKLNGGRNQKVLMGPASHDKPNRPNADSKISVNSTAQYVRLRSNAA